MRVHVYQKFAFSRRTEVLKPGTYKVDKLTMNAIRQSASDLVRQGLIRFEDDQGLVPPIDPDRTAQVLEEFQRAEDFTDFAEQIDSVFGVDVVGLDGA